MAHSNGHLLDPFLYCFRVAIGRMSSDLKGPSPIFKFAKQYLANAIFKTEFMLRKWIVPKEVETEFNSKGARCLCVKELLKYWTIIKFITNSKPDGLL